MKPLFYVSEVQLKLVEMLSTLSAPLTNPITPLNVSPIIKEWNVVSYIYNSVD